MMFRVGVIDVQSFHIFQIKKLQVDKRQMRKILIGKFSLSKATTLRKTVDKVRICCAVGWFNGM